MTDATTQAPKSHPGLVSVVIPTLLRPSLARAIDSARQSSPAVDLEIVVVVDRAKSDVTLGETALSDRADVVLFTGGHCGASVARNLGLEQSTGAWVAFLDDDDEWLPGKLAQQLQEASSVAAESGVVVATRVIQKAQGRNGVESVSRPVPDRTIRDAEAVEDYLFGGRKPSFGRSGIWTSSLMVDGETARSVPWDVTLPRHQDWDWLLRLQAIGAHVIQSPAALTVVWMESTDSISASGDWAASLAWWQTRRGSWKPRTSADFIVGQPLRYAIQSRSAKGVAACLRAIVSTRRVPRLAPTILGASALVPRKQAVRMAFASARLRRRLLWHARGDTDL